MKKYYLILTSLVLPLQVFAQNQTMQTFIDFNTFEEQIQQVYPNPENQLLSVEGQSIAEIGSELFMLDNWLVTPNPSSTSPVTAKDSYTKKVDSGERGTVLGTRASFPKWPHDGEVAINPKFPILPFGVNGEYININNGVVTNVGSIKSFSMWVNGRNFSYNAGFRVKDMVGKITEFPLGSLFYVGWRKLVYINPFFSDKAINNIRPNTRIYPSEIPLLSFDSIMIYRQGNQAGGDFIGYFGSADIEYIPYITEMPTDIDDEGTWSIIKTTQEERAANMNNFLYEEILQYEYAKQRVLGVEEDENNNNEEEEEEVIE